jgi:hypothetical protein
MRTPTVPSLHPSDCCAIPAPPAAPSTASVPQASSHEVPHGHSGGGSWWRLTTSATAHCLSGCVIGEFIGLAIGVSLGWSAWATMSLATVLAFASGYTLGLWPLVKRGMGWWAAFKTLWLGETVSIGVMEVAMNLTDYHVGGVTAGSIFEPMFWIGFAVAVPAGFAAAWPVNGWLLKRRIKPPCH